MRRLRVVSWNVGRIYSRSNNNRLDDNDLPQVARTLAELGADVVLLQEVVSPRQLDALLVRLPHYHGALAQRCRYDRHSAVLLRAPLAARFDEHVLDSGRGIVSASFAANGAALDVAVMSVHFDILRPWRRREQAEEVAALADARGEAVVIVGGDLNLDPAFARGSHNAVDVETFAYLTTRLDDAGATAGPTLMGLLRVDHLLVRGVLSHRARVSPRRLPLGDHHPLVLDVDLPLAVA